jgi:hypothetical protein
MLQLGVVVCERVPLEEGDEGTMLTKFFFFCFVFTVLKFRWGIKIEIFFCYKTPPPLNKKKK